MKDGNLVHPPDETCVDRIWSRDVLVSVHWRSMAIGTPASSCRIPTAAGAEEWSIPVDRRVSCGLLETSLLVLDGMQ